jgi:hypothetical protein
MRGLAEIFGQDLVQQKIIARVLPPFFDRAQVLVVLIGRRPVHRDRIDALQHSLIELQQSQGRTISNRQRTALQEAAQEMGKDYHPTFHVYYNWLDSEAKQYASLLAQVLVPVGAFGIPTGTREVTDEMEGLIIRG